MNTLQTYSADEVASLMKCHRNRVNDWMKVGLLRGIKTGKGTVFTFWELKRFQEEMAGKDISNLPATIETERRTG